MKREGAREIPDPNNREANEPPPFIDIGKPKSSVEGVQPPPLPESVRMEEIPPLINEKPEENLAITDAKEDFLELLNKSDTLSEEEKLKFTKKLDEILKQNPEIALPKIHELIDNLDKYKKTIGLTAPTSFETGIPRLPMDQILQDEYEKSGDTLELLSKQYDLPIQPDGTVRGWGNNRKLKKLLKTDEAFLGRYERIKATYNPMNVPPPGKVKRFFHRVGIGLGLLTAAYVATETHTPKEDKDVTEISKNWTPSSIPLQRIPTAERRDVNFQEAEQVRGSTQEQYNLAAAGRLMRDMSPSTEKKMAKAFSRGKTPEVSSRTPLKQEIPQTGSMADISKSSAKQPGSISSGPKTEARPLELDLGDHLEIEDKQPIPTAEGIAAKLTNAEIAENIRPIQPRSSSIETEREGLSTQLRDSMAVGLFNPGLFAKSYNVPLEKVLKDAIGLAQQDQTLQHMLTSLKKQLKVEQELKY